MTGGSNNPAPVPDQFLKTLGDGTRLRILVLLATEGELCVCELTHALGEIQPKISRHLAQLREHGIVLDRRQGQWIYYRVNPGLPAWSREVLAAVVAGARSQSPYLDDLKSLAGMPDRPGNACCT